MPSNIKIKEAHSIKENESNQSSYKPPNSATRKQKISPTKSLHLSGSDQKKKNKSKKEGMSNYDDAKARQKVIDLEDQICVMKEQHLNLLESLHKEIEMLKIKNKGKLIFSFAVTFRFGFSF